MRKRAVGIGLCAAVVIAGVACSLGFGWETTAEKKVREGLQHFAAGEFAAAGEAFTEADVAQPEEATIAFDRACALAAAGDVEKARELLQQSALARDSRLAAQSHYNLGALAAAQGRATLGEDPIAVQPAQREPALAKLMTAVQHYRDCLELDAEHADARHNLELIRLFIKYIQVQWQERDREQQRKELGLLEFLAMIEGRQTALRGAVGALSRESDSPARRQAIRETSEDQSELAEEIPPLKEKIAEQLQQPQPAAGSSAAGQQPSPTPSQGTRHEQALQLLNQLADAAEAKMRSAETSLLEGDFLAARQQQRVVLDELNQIFMAVAPFTSVLERATKQQTRLVATSETVATAVQPSDDSGEEEGAESASEAKKLAQVSPDAETSEIDTEELEWQQSQVTHWSRMLGLKAEAELPGVESQLQAAQTSAAAAEPATKDDNDQQATTAATEDPSAQLEAMKKSLEKAIELSPQIEQLSSSAAGELGKSNLAAALPNQQQAEKLLREIAEPIAQENQQQGDRSQEGENNQNQDQQQQQDGQQQQADSQDQRPQDSEQEQPQGQTPQERAESVLRRARQREREHRDLEKQLQQRIGGGARVDRDW